MTQTATSPQRKPLLDEASFQQLLSAAYVLQEHNDRLRAKGFQADFAENLSAIVETQKLIQTLQLDLAAAAELVAERVQKITNAAGTAIGIIEKGQLSYRAATGSAAGEAGTLVTPESALSADCLTRGTALNYPDVTPSLHVHADLFRARDVKAFIAVPVYHAGQVAGVLELRFSRPNSFRESDVRAAELMAGLLSEAMVTASRMKWKEALASERQSMLEALERIKPQIERLGSDSATLEGAVTAKSSVERPAEKLEPASVRGADTCSACGSEFFDEGESFCGICGTARPITSRRRDVSGSNRPLKADPPWLIPYGQENPSNGNSGVASQETLPAWPSVPNPVESQPTIQTESVLKPVLETAPVPAALTIPPAAQIQTSAQVPATDSLRIVPADNIPADNLPADLAANKNQAYPWGSAKKAQQWLETVKTQHPRAEWLAQQWQRRRANIYVVVAALILLLVISGWGIRPAGTRTAGNVAPAQSSQKPAPPPQPQLTMLEKLMVSLGLAEPPPPPVNMGNPETQVWVDVHTALYYCPGADLYGKTADGKFAAQRDAQQDQFEPANRKACQ